MSAAVVVSYRTPQLLLRCIDSLLAQGREVETVVVDNHSGNETAAVLGDRPGIRLLEMPENRGFGAAANAGAVLTKGDPLLILNADVYLLPGCLQALQEALDRRPDWGLAAPVLLNVDGSVQENSFRFPGLVQTLIDLAPAPSRLRRSRLNGRYPESWALTRDHEIDHPLGACLLIRRAVWDRLGGFDTDFFMYCEEIDLCRRLRRSGWRSGHVHAAKAVHVGGASTRRAAGAMTEELYISRVKYHRKHSSAGAAALNKALIVGGLLLRGVASLPVPGPDRRAAGRHWLSACLRAALA